MFCTLYPNCRLFYFTFDYAGVNDAKQITSQKRAGRDLLVDATDVAQDEDLWQPANEKPFSNRLFPNRKWRSRTLFAWFNRALDYITTPADVTMVFHGLSSESYTSDPFNTLQVRLCNGATARSEQNAVCHRYMEGDQRQLLHLHNHEEQVVIIENRDGDLFSGCLLFQDQWFPQLRHQMIFKYGDAHFDINAILDDVQKELAQCTWYNADTMNAARIVSSLLFARGNDFVTVPLSYVSMDVMWATLLDYGDTFPRWLTQLHFNHFERFATLCYLTCNNGNIVRPEAWIQGDVRKAPLLSYTSLWTFPKMVKQPVQCDRFNEFARRHAVRLMPGETCNALKSMLKHRGMLAPARLPILWAQIRFTLRYNEVLPTTAPSFTLRLDPFAKDDSGLSVHGYILQGNKAQVASLVSGNALVQQLCKYV